MKRKNKKEDKNKERQEGEVNKHETEKKICSVDIPLGFNKLEWLGPLKHFIDATIRALGLRVLRTEKIKALQFSIPLRYACSLFYPLSSLYNGALKTLFRYYPIIFQSRIYQMEWNSTFENEKKN